jgi:predicted transcriptional regulator
VWKISSYFCDENFQLLTMASPKLAAFSVEENKLAELAKALGHPARIAILKELARRNTCVCGEIVEVLPLAQSTVSQHLKELKDAGLIQGTLEGAKSCYCIDWDNMRHLQGLIASFLPCCEPDTNCC